MRLVTQGIRFMYRFKTRVWFVSWQSFGFFLPDIGPQDRRLEFTNMGNWVKIWKHSKVEKERYIPKRPFRLLSPPYLREFRIDGSYIQQVIEHPNNCTWLALTVLDNVWEIDRE